MSVLPPGVEPHQVEGAEVGEAVGAGEAGEAGGADAGVADGVAGVGGAGSAVIPVSASVRVMASSRT